MWEVENVNAEGCVFVVNGETFSVPVGENLKDKVIEFAKIAKYSKFRLYIEGVEVAPNEAPLYTENGKEYKISAFDVAG